MLRDIKDNQYKKTAHPNILSELTLLSAVFLDLIWEITWTMINLHVTRKFATQF